MLTDLVDRIAGRADDDAPDPSTARGRDELLRQRWRELTEEREEKGERLEQLEDEVPLAVAAGDGDGRESRAERMELRAEVEELEAGLAKIREAREKLAPEVLKEEGEEEAPRSHWALQRAEKAAKDLGEALDRLLATKVAELEAAYSEARRATGRVREIERELANEYGEDRDFDRATNMNSKLEREAPNGLAAWRAMEEYARNRRE